MILDTPNRDFISSRLQDSGKGGANDDSDEDPDFDQAAAEKEREKKRQKKLDEARREKEKCSSPAPGRPGRPAGRPAGGSGQVGRKRPLGNNIKCPFCDEGFNTVEIVMEHMMASHENDKK